MEWNEINVRSVLSFGHVLADLLDASYRNVQGHSVSAVESGSR